MGADPFNTIRGLVTNPSGKVNKADFIAYMQRRPPIAFDDVAELQGTSVDPLRTLVFVGAALYERNDANPGADDGDSLIEDEAGGKWEKRAGLQQADLDAAIGTVNSALALKAALASPALTGNPTAPTQSVVDVSTKIATTAYVWAAIAAWLDDVATLTGKTIDAAANTISNLTLAMFAANVIDTDGTLAANSDSRLATQKAVKTALDAVVAGGGLIIGTTSVSGGADGDVLFRNGAALGGQASTGTGNVVRATSPTMVTPTIGNAAATTVTATGGTVAANAPPFSLTQTWNNAAITFYAFFANITNTASAAASRLLDLQVGGVSQFSVSRTGALTLLGDIVSSGSISAVIGSATIAAGGGYNWNTLSKITSPGDGTIRFTNQAANAFTMLQLGGSTSSFPALKRSSATLQARLADDSANAVFNAATLTSDGTVNVGAGFTLAWPSSSRISAPSDGVIRLTNQAVTDFARLQLGGTTSSFPSLKRVATAIAARLADDSADAPFTAAAITASGALAAPSINIAGGGAVAFLAQGTYTPDVATLVATNVDSANNFLCHYTRVGNHVMVTGRITIDATAAGAFACSMTLPVASNFGSSTAAGGAAFATGENNGCAIDADSTNDCVIFRGVATLLTGRSYTFMFGYTVS